MANKQINELSELTTASGTDLILVYDLNEAGSEKSKKIEVDNIITPYEEGTWTPVPADAQAGGNTGTAGTALGVYTKIGRQVTINCTLTNINTSGMTGSNNIFVRGLPYADIADTSFFGSVRLDNVTVAFNYIISSTLDGSLDVVWFPAIDSGQSVDGIRVQDLISTTADIRFTLTYFI